MVANPELEKALRALRAAIEDEGPMPTYHQRVMRRTEKDWPSLMKAVRAVLKASK